MSNTLEVMSKIARVVRTLIDNAINYSPPANPVTIHLGLIGADPPHLFESFFRSLEVRRGHPGPGTIVLDTGGPADDAAAGPGPA